MNDYRNSFLTKVISLLFVVNLIVINSVGSNENGKDELVKMVLNNDPAITKYLNKSNLHNSDLLLELIQNNQSVPEAYTLTILRLLQSNEVSSELLKHMFKEQIVYTLENANSNKNSYLNITVSTSNQSLILQLSRDQDFFGEKLDPQLIIYEPGNSNSVVEIDLKNFQSDQNFQNFIELFENDITLNYDIDSLVSDTVENSECHYNSHTFSFNGDISDQNGVQIFESSYEGTIGEPIIIKNDIVYNEFTSMQSPDFEPWEFTSPLPK